MSLNNTLLSFAITTTNALILLAILSQPVDGQNTNVYENSEIGLRFSYPSNWYIQEITENGIAYPPTDYNSTSIVLKSLGAATIAVHVTPKFGTIEEYVEGDIQFLSSLNTGAKIQGKGYVEVNGNKAYGFSTIEPKKYFGDMQRHFHDTTLYFDVKDTIYEFYLGSPGKEDYVKGLPAYEQIVTSSQLSGFPQNLNTQPTQKNQFDPFGSNS